MNVLLPVILLLPLLSACVTERKWVASKIAPAAGIAVDMIELNRSVDDFAEIYQPFYDSVKASTIPFTDKERAVLKEAHLSLVLVRGYIQSIHDSAFNPRQAVVKIEQLQGMVEPIIGAVNDSIPILDKYKRELSIENQARLRNGLALFEQASEQARQIVESESAQEAQRKIKRLLTVGSTIFKLALLV